MTTRISLDRAAWLAVLALGGCMRPLPTADTRVGFVYVGPVVDHGWTLTHELGRQYLEEVSGVETRFAPSVAPSDAPAVVEQFVQDGDTIVVSTSFDLTGAVQTGAANHADRSFLACSGFVTSPNLGSYFGRMYQAEYLLGQLAGHQSCTGRVGIVASMPFPEMVSHINAFALGLQEVDPTAHLYVEWINDWFDPKLEPLATQRLIDAGVDVIHGHTDTTIPLEVANGQTVDCDGEQSPVLTLGYNNPDACTFGPESCLSSAYWNWGPYLVDVVDQITSETWDAREIVWEGLQGDPERSMFYLAPMSERVPSAVQVAVQDKIGELSQPDALRRPFVGPLRDVDGAVRVAEGDEVTDDDLLRMCWLVDGVYLLDGALDDLPGAVPPGCQGDL